MRGDVLESMCLKPSKILENCAVDIQISGENAEDWKLKDVIIALL